LKIREAGGKNKTNTPPRALLTFFIGLLPVGCLIIKEHGIKKRGPQRIGVNTVCLDL
jgi:hypothetical protein